jgi:hypothetical protein
MKVGQYVCLTIVDHCKGSCAMELLTFEVTGKVLSLNRECAVLGTWVEPDATIDSNTETYAIIRSAIRKVRILR